MNISDVKMDRINDKMNFVMFCFILNELQFIIYLKHILSHKTFYITFLNFWTFSKAIM